jgi:hypothetical protein
MRVTRASARCVGQTDLGVAGVANGRLQSIKSPDLSLTEVKDLLREIDRSVSE